MIEQTTEDMTLMTAWTEETEEIERALFCGLWTTKEREPIQEMIQEIDLVEDMREIYNK